MKSIVIFLAAMTLATTTFAEWPDMFELRMPLGKWKANKVKRRTALLVITGKNDTKKNRREIDKGWMEVVDGGTTTMVWQVTQQQVCQVPQRKIRRVMAILHGDGATTYKGKRIHRKRTNNTTIKVAAQ